MMLADLGADVVRVDRPGGRQLGRPDASDPMLRGRRRVDANLKTESGRETVFRLIRQADVLMEGYRPGVAERLGVGPASACPSTRAWCTPGPPAGGRPARWPSGPGTTSTTWRSPAR